MRQTFLRKSKNPNKNGVFHKRESCVNRKVMKTCQQLSIGYLQRQERYDNNNAMRYIDGYWICTNGLSQIREKIPQKELCVLGELCVRQK